MEYTSKGVGNAALTTGIIGTGLGVLNGGLSMLTGGINKQPTNSDDEYVTRYELSMQNQLMEKDREIAILTSEKDTEIKIADVYERVMTRVNQDQRDQANWNASQSVANAQMSAAIATNTNSINNLSNTIGSVTKVVIPNYNVSPGWGRVDISPMPSTFNGNCCTGTTLA